MTHIDKKAGIVTFNNHGVVQEIPLVKAPPISTPTPVVMNSAFTAPGAAPGGFGGPGVGNSTRYGNNPGPNGSPGGNVGNSGGPPRQQISPEEQMILIAAQHAQAQQAGDPIAKIFPPTELDGAAGVVPDSPSGGPSTP